MDNLNNEIKAYAVKNALEFGKADAGRILPKLFNHGLKKENVKNIIIEINKVVKEINDLNKEQLELLFSRLKQYIKERDEEEKGLSELPNSGKNMVFRLAPYPSGALHIGNAKTYVLNALYSEKYKAKTLLVMDDTIGSEEKQSIKEAYKLIEEGFDWLNVKYDKPIIYKSDRLKIYYEYAEKLISLGKAYVCHCIQEVLRENRNLGIECKCRKIEINEQKNRWKEMFSLEEGKAVLRLKTDMAHPNPAFRDRVLFKISDRVHVRVGKKYRVWPTLEMTWAIDDHLLGITHIIRGNDLMIESDMEKYIWDIFNWNYPTIVHTGLVKIEGTGGKLSKSKAQKEVKSGEFEGWDDPRTWSLQSLMRRGILPESFREFIESIGLNKSDITIPIDTLYSINRKKVDSEALRYSFVENPVELIFKNELPLEIVDVAVHPDKKETREIKVQKIFISKQDYEKYFWKEVRLIHLFNIKLEEKCSVTSRENKPIQKIQWVSENVNVRIKMSDAKWTEGIGEKAVSKIKVGDMIQFERVGFCRFDGKVKVGDKEFYDFWFGHK